MLSPLPNLVHSGGSIAAGFEGGQTPIYKRLPKRGFTAPNLTPLETLSVTRIANYLTMGRLSPKGTGLDGMITMSDLQSAGVVNKIKHGVKLLATDHSNPCANVQAGAWNGLGVHLEVSMASAGAIAAVEALGGNVTAAHFNRLALRALLKPHKFMGELPRRARPPPKLRDYYTRFEHRGFLSPEVQLRKLESQVKS